MKPVLTLAALLVGLATPALAEDAATTTAPATPVPAVVEQAAPAVLPQPAALPQAKAAETAATPAPVEAAGSGGCRHGKDVVYLTN